MNVLLLCVALAGICAALWALPCGCDNVPGFVRYFSDLAKKLLRTLVLCCMLLIVVVIFLGVGLLLACFWFCWAVYILLYILFGKETK